MRYIWQHIETIVNTYDGSLPLTHFLKQYYKRHPQLGSRDRKILSEMAYCWYRVSKAIALNGFEEKVRACLQLSGNDAVKQRFPYEGAIETNMDLLFPYPVAISADMDREEWLRSVLVQPSLFIRIRKNKGVIEGLLTDKQISFSYITDTCMALPNGAAIDTILPADSYVVQDASSQQTGTYFKPRAGEHWLDCCSGAGGKSLLLKDMEPSVKLAVSDIRDTILHNLRERFRGYGHQAPVTYTTNVSDAKALAATLKGAHFDNIICDVPCSGSGTWARTPEQMYFFDPKEVGRFSDLQTTIATNVAKYLKPGGRLIYITCSVFDEENQKVVNAVVEKTHLKCISSGIINGIGIKADSMFAAVLEKQ
jgi:16S rRNA (cytosine967-C5)-methyltransferase